MTEAQLETEALGWLVDVGCTCRHGMDISPGSNLGGTEIPLTG